MDAAIFGLIVADLIASPMNLRQPPAPGGLAVLDTLELTTGGNVCNTGVAMAKLGMKVAVAGLVGNDVLGVAITDRLRQAGLDVACVFADDRAQTSATVVAVEPGGERVFFHTPGVTKLLDAAVFRRCIPTFAACAVVQVGYFGLLPALTPELPNVLAELKRAAPNTKIALDTVNPPADGSLLWPILPYLDLFAPSRTEAQALTGESTPHKMVAALRERMGDGLIGIKLDAEGCYLDDGQVSATIPAYKITPVDTTGAGDTWFGGLLTALAKNMPLEQAGKFANRAAADCCTAFGASAGVRSFEETVKRL
ncbi:MAG: carbohydrate kinase family protein [Planctomycetota bacterium]|nr:carbohydrate kinase family protein [Planctomycetota bacterium]